jgi:hypothetical protein
LGIRDRLAELFEWKRDENPVAEEHAGAVEKQTTF